MKYEFHDGDTLHVFPENSIDTFWLGKIWGKHGGNVMFMQSTDDPKEISHYEIEIQKLFKILIDP